MRARKHKDRLIGIRQHDLLICPLRSRVEPDDCLLPFLDLFDHPASIRQNRDPDPVSQSRDIAGCASFLQLAAQLTNNETLPGIHSEETRLGFDNQTLCKYFVRQ
jgi:hypothetical protein